MMENEMIKWFIDNLKPPYYKQMISTEVTRFASLILIREHIDEGSRSKKIMDVESLSSMVEQKVKRMTSHKTKEANVHMVDNASERPRGVAPAYVAPAAKSYRNRDSLPKCLTEPLIRKGGQTHLFSLGGKNESTLHYLYP